MKRKKREEREEEGEEEQEEEEEEGSRLLKVNKRAKRVTGNMLFGEEVIPAVWRYE